MTDGQLFEEYANGKHYIEIARDHNMSVIDVMDSLNRVWRSMVGVDKRV